MVPKHVKMGLIQEHPNECELFNKMVKDEELRLDPMLVKRVIALWLALEGYGYQEFTKVVLRQDNETIGRLFSDGLAILECIEPGAKPIDQNSELWRYYNERKSIYNSYRKILTTLCNNIFGEFEALEVVKIGDRRVIKEARPFGEGSSGQGGDHFSLPETPPDSPGSDGGYGGGVLGWDNLQSSLSPNASPYQPVATREIFVTFRFGLPLTTLEMTNYFNQLFRARIVENVNVMRHPLGYPPLSAVVTFTDNSVVPRVLGGGTAARHTTGDGKDMWVTAYDSIPIN